MKVLPCLLWGHIHSAKSIVSCFVIHCALFHLMCRFIHLCFLTSLSILSISLDCPCIKLESCCPQHWSLSISRYTYIYMNLLGWGSLADNSNSRSHSPFCRLMTISPEQIFRLSLYLFALYIVHQSSSHRWFDLPTQHLPSSVVLVYIWRTPLHWLLWRE